MSYCGDHDETRCWACGGATDAPVRGLCLECYTRLQEPGRIGHALVECRTSAPPFVTPLATLARAEEAAAAS